MATTTRSHTRAAAAAVLLGLIGLVGAACGPPPPSAPYYGISFWAPNVEYIGHSFTPEPTATSGLPVQLALDPSSTGCTFAGGVVSFTSVGTCIINANEPGDATHAASAQVQRYIGVYPCPPLREGLWTGPLGLSAVVNVSGPTFFGTIDLTGFGGIVQNFIGTVNCQNATMTFNGVNLSGYLSTDGSTLTSSYQGITFDLHAPPLPA